MGGKEIKKEPGVDRLAERAKRIEEIIGESKQILWWEKQIDGKEIRLIQLRTLSQENAKELEGLGPKFSEECRGRINESKNVPFSFFLDSVSSSKSELPELKKSELPELKVSSMIRFRDKNQAKGRAFLFSLKSEERLFGLAKFGEKYDGVHHRDLGPGYFALVIFLKGI